MSRHQIAITANGRYSLACWHGLPEDDEHVRFAGPGDRWDEITADVARQAARLREKTR